MADFQFRTRGQQSPQGKQRVYFTCHPDDFEKYFEEIQKEILDRQDCAVFYLEPETQPEDVEDYELRLREMQLFVVPVTTKLLTKANRAMGVEVPFAFENHIPVLPLMQESGLDDVFNAKFGDLQYLYKYDDDPTAIPYDEKLTKYLESVIVGDELAKKVRAAFDAYIFLSYRKKDRKYAQELMKLIHSNPICRDIAIWYDEFLTPGENFNEAIRAALEKSELFALTVTPNLINEINYIMTTEYPMARDLGKKILPAEMKQTDREKLQSMYDAIPELIEKGDTTALADRLSSLFESLAIRENDIDPQHNFFIGLAYLGGIDVEVDHKKALELIINAAKRDYLPAIKKLVSMHNNGEGVERNYNKAIEWQEILVKSYIDIYNTNPVEKHAIDLLECLHFLGDSYSRVDSLDLAKDTFYEAMKYSESFSKCYNNISFDINRIIYCQKIGKLFERKGELLLSLEWYKKGLTLLEKCESQTPNYSFRRMRASLYSSLGNNSALLAMHDVLSKTEYWAYTALDWHEKSVALAEIEYHEKKTTDSLLNLASHYGNMGKFLSLWGEDKQDALIWSNKARRILEQFLDNTSISMDRDDVLMCYHNLFLTYDILGSIANEQKQKEKAEKWYRKSLSICKKFYQEAQTHQSKSDLACAYRSLGFLILNSEMTRKATELWEQLSEQCSDDELYSGKADLAGIMTAFLERKEKVKKNRDTCKILSAKIEMLPSPCDSSVSYIKSGDIARTKGKLSEAESWYCKGMVICKSLAEEEKTAKSRHDLSVVYAKLGDVADAQEKLNDAEKWYRKSLALSESLAEETKTAESHDNVAVLNYKIGCLIMHSHFLEKALNIWLRLSAQYPEKPRYYQCSKIVKDTIQRLFPDD